MYFLIGDVDPSPNKSLLGKFAVLYVCLSDLWFRQSISRSPDVL